MFVKKGQLRIWFLVFWFAALLRSPLEEKFGGDDGNDQAGPVGNRVTEERTPMRIRV